MYAAARSYKPRQYIYMAGLFLLKAVSVLGAQWRCGGVY